MRVRAAGRAQPAGVGAPQRDARDRRNRVHAGLHVREQSQVWLFYLNSGSQKLWSYVCETVWSLAFGFPAKY